MSTRARSSEQLEQEIAAHDWYHTLELPSGVLTPGWSDLRKTIESLPFPPDLSGARCLDIGTFDGFWAFSMERRGASEVVAIDVIDPRGWDWPRNSAPETMQALDRRKAGGTGFELAHRAFNSKVERHELSVYDLDPDRHGRFDFIYVGSILLHLRDPIRALERVAAVATGDVLIVDAVGLAASLLRRRPLAELDGLGRPWWWKPNAAGLGRMVEAAGLSVQRGPRLVFMPPGKRQSLLRLRPRSVLYRVGREAVVRSILGDPHAWILARP